MKLAIEMRERQWVKARAQAGLSGLPEPPTDPSLPPLKQSQPVRTPKKVKMRAPDGTVEEVDANEVELFKQRGAVVVP